MNTIRAEAKRFYFGIFCSMGRSKARGQWDERGKGDIMIRRRKVEGTRSGWRAKIGNKKRKGRGVGGEI